MVKKYIILNYNIKLQTTFKIPIDRPEKKKSENRIRYRWVCGTISVEGSMGRGR